MDSMYSKYHKLSETERKELYKARYYSETTVKTKLDIKPLNFQNSYELYYLPTVEHIKFIEDIYKNNKTLITITKKLPKIAKKQFFQEMLVTELFNTNKIEGVRSSKKELRESLEIISQKTKSNINKNFRFKSLVTSYDNLLESRITFPKTAKEIRYIYDEIIAEEVSANNRIDGKYFRLESVDVNKKSGSGKVIHKGLVGEYDIIEKLTQLLDLVNNNNEIPNLIKIALFYYYFGYIHPFYDGNGRTGRFLTSIYLKEEIGKYTAISLSLGLYNNSKNHFSEFEKTNSFKNYGELNAFVTMFLQSIILGQNEVIETLKNKKYLLELAVSKIESLENKMEKDILFIFAQIELFSGNKLVSRSFIRDFIREKGNISVNKIDSCLERLEKIGTIKKVTKRPIEYKINEDYFETIV